MTVMRMLALLLSSAAILGGIVTGTTLRPPVSRSHVAVTPPPAPAGGFTEVTLPLDDPSRPTVSQGVQIRPDRPLTTMVWVPTAPGRHPLVVFAPGYEVGPTPYVGLLQAWAGEGYVVAAIEFPLTDAAVAGPNLDEGDIQNQPADVEFVTAALIAPGSPVAAEIDPQEIALAGHSDGAETVLAATFGPSPPGDPPVRAVIAMLVRPLLTSDTAANPPILVTQGDADTIDDPSLGYDAYDLAASPKYLAVLQGGGHLDPLEAGSAWFGSIVAVTSAFLRCYLEGAPAGAILQAGDPGLVTVSAG
jgi:Chlorophyllase enzyme